MNLPDLTNDERLALGGLLRILLRADGEFSEAEESRMDAVGDELGGKDLLWKAVSDSAQHFKSDQAIRSAGLGIERPEVRSLVLSVLESIAIADTMSPGEEGVLSALKAHWGIAE